MHKFASLPHTVDTATAQECKGLLFLIDDQRAHQPSVLPTISVEGQQQRLRSAAH